MGNILLSTSTTNIMNGLDYAWEAGESISWVIASNYVAKAIFFFLLVAFLFVLCKSGLSFNKMHSQWEENAIQLITLIILMAICGGFWGWGAIMLGKKPTQPTASIVNTEFVQEGDSKPWMQLEL